MFFSVRAALPGAAYSRAYSAVTRGSRFSAFLIAHLHYVICVWVTIGNTESSLPALQTHSQLVTARAHVVCPTHTPRGAPLTSTIAG